MVETAGELSTYALICFGGSIEAKHKSCLAKVDWKPESAVGGWVISSRAPAALQGISEAAREGSETMHLLPNAKSYGKDIVRFRKEFRVKCNHQVRGSSPRGGAS